VNFYAYITGKNKYSFSPLLAAATGRIKPLKGQKPGAGDAVLFSFQSPDWKETWETLKRLPRGVVKVAGGAHPSGLPLHALDMGFDFVFSGEGEEHIHSLLNFLEGRGEPPPCLWSRERMGTVCRGVEIEKFAPFAEDLPIPIEITRGCPFLCAYCQTPRLSGRKMRHRSLETIVRWVEKLVNRGMKDIRFITPNGMGYGGRGGAQPQRLLSLLRLLKKKYPRARFYMGSFPSEFRPEHISLSPMKALRNLVSNRRVIFGAQSGSPEVLRRIKRGHTVEDVVRAAEVSLKANFRPEVDFIFGLPFDDEEESLRLMKRLAEMGARVHAHYFLPLPSTPLALEKPRPLSGPFLREVEKLTGAGTLFGQWKRQMALSLELYRLNRMFSTPYVGEEDKGNEKENNRGAPSR